MKERLAWDNYTHVICNPQFTAYVTLPRKDRMSIIEILSQTKELPFKFGEIAFVVMAEMGLGLSDEKMASRTRSLAGRTKF